MTMTSPPFLDHSRSAALGKLAPIDAVPVGFMVLATCPLILWLLDGTVAGIASAFFVIALFTLGLLCLSVGHKNHLTYEQSEVARRPAIPLKFVGSVILSMVVGLLATTKIDLPMIAILISCATFILCLVSFGLDPMRDKGLDNPTVMRRFENERLVEAVEQRLEDMLNDVRVLHDDDLAERVRSKLDSVMSLLATVDLESHTLGKIAPTLIKIVSRMEDETNGLMASQSHLTPFLRRKYLVKMQALTEAFEARARKMGVAAGRDAFELQTELLLNRMHRPHRA